MKIGNIVSLPNRFTEWAQIRDKVTGAIYTVSSKLLDKNVQEGDQYAYKVELWENESGLVYQAEKPEDE